MSQETLFLAEKLCKVSWVLRQHFLACKMYFSKPYQPMYCCKCNSMLVKVFLGAMVYKCAFFWETWGQSLQWCHNVSEGYFCLFRSYINLYSVGTAIMLNKMYGFRDTSVERQRWPHRFSNGCSYFSKYVNFCTVNITSIKIFFGQRCTVLVKKGGHTLQFQQPRT